MIITPSQDQPSAQQSLRGQIYRGGITVGIACAFLVGGFSLAFGVEEITAVGLAMTSFLVIGTLSWLADLLVGPALERVAQQREDERLALERELTPSDGGVLPSLVSLTGGQESAAGVVGGAAIKGRRLDFTLPEETIASVPGAAGAALGGGLVGKSPSGRLGGAAFASAGGAIASAPAIGGALPIGVSPGGEMPGAMSGANQSGDEFQDLASLLREAAAPVPGPAARAR